MIKSFFGKEEWVKILKIAFPMILAALINIIMGMTDIAIVGHYSTHGLVGVSAGVTIVTIGIELVGAFFIGHYILASRRFGSNSLFDIGKGLVAASYLAIIISIIATILLVLTIPSLTEIVLNNDEEQKIAVNYILWRLPGILFFSLSYVLQSIFDCKGNSKIGMYSSLVAVILNIPLAFMFTFGFYFIPQMGAEGTGLATSFASISRFIILIIFFIKDSKLKDYKLSIKLDIKELWNQLKITFPEFVTTIFFSFSSYVLLYLMGMIENGVSAGRILLLNVNLVFLLAFRFGISLQICLGHEIGKKDNKAFKSFMTKGSSLVFIIISLIGSLYLFIPSYIALIFTDIKSISSVVRDNLWIIGITAPLLALTMIYTAPLKAHSQTKVVMYSNIFALWIVQIPIAWYLGIHWNLGLEGIFLSYAAFYLTRWLLLYITYKRKIKSDEISYKNEEATI